MRGQHLTLLLQAYSRRKRLLCVLALAATLCVSPQLQAASNDEDPKKNERPKKGPNQSEDKAAADPSDTPVDPKKKSILTIRVSGGQKPTEQAEVRVKKSGAAEEIRRFTNSRGQIVFSSLDAGTVEILVIAKGWKTNRREITLKAGDNPLDIELDPL